MSLTRPSAQYFVSSSLAPVLLFRCRFKSVADLLDGTRQKAPPIPPSQARWKAVCDQSAL